MIRRYCDVCGIQVTGVCIPDNKLDEEDSPTGNNNGRYLMCEVLGKYDNLKVEVRGSIRGEADGGDICKYCVIDAVKQFDDREVVQPTEGSIAKQ